MQWHWLVAVALGLTGCRTVYVVDAAALHHARKKIRTGDVAEPMIRAGTPGGRHTYVKASMARGVVSGSGFKTTVEFEDPATGV